MAPHPTTRQPLEGRDNGDGPGSATTRPSTRPPIWRRRWIVDAPFQWNLIVRSMVQTVVTLAFVMVGIFGPIIGKLASADANSTTDDPAIVMLYMHSRFWWIAAACLLLASISALLVSHRIAGPLVRFKRNLRTLGQGKLPAPLRTRARDHLKLEVDCLNEAVAGIARRVADLRTVEAELAASLQRCADEFDGGSDSDARDALVAAKAAATRLATELAAFHSLDDPDATRTAAIPTTAAPALTPAH